MCTVLYCYLCVRVQNLRVCLISIWLEFYDNRRTMMAINICIMKKNKVVISDGSNSLSSTNNKMPLYILPLRGSIIRCRHQISQRCRHLKTLPRRTPIDVSAVLTVMWTDSSQTDTFQCFMQCYTSTLSFHSPGSHTENKQVPIFGQENMSEKLLKNTRMPPSVSCSTLLLPYLTTSVRFSHAG